MTLGELLDELIEVDSATRARNDNYEIIIERDNLDSEPTLKVTGIRWEHADGKVVIEATS
jgi:hypothetical protein